MTDLKSRPVRIIASHVAVVDDYFNADGRGWFQLKGFEDVFFDTHAVVFKTFFDTSQLRKGNKLTVQYTGRKLTLENIVRIVTGSGHVVWGQLS